METEKDGLRELILSKGISLAAFARAMGITPQSLQHWFTRGIPGSRIFAVADALGVSSDELRDKFAEGKRKHISIDEEVQHFRLLFAQLPPIEQKRVLKELRNAQKQ